MSYKLLGIEVERKTDILAFAAFLISITTLLTQAVSLIKGPEVVLEKPRQVLITSDTYPDGNKYTRISAKLVYLNKGSPGYDDIIKTEDATIVVGNREIALIGQEYIDSSERNNKLVINKMSDADPVQIKSGAVVFHETYFSPWPDESKQSNYVLFSDFISSIKGLSTIDVIFTISTFGGTSKTQTCTLSTEEFIHHLDDKGWSAPVCK